MAETSISEAVNLANKEFIKGFVFGQIILCVLIFFLVNVFLLRNSDETKADLASRKAAGTRWRQKKLQPLPMRQHALESHVLSKINYQVHSHQPESCDWINVLLAQVIARFRSDPAVSANIVRFIDIKMNGSGEPSSRPSFLGPIAITEFSLGEEYPKLKAAKMQYAEQSSNLRAEIDFEFHDQITIGVDTTIIINWPKPCIASLPVSLALSIVKFSGTFAIEFVTHPDSPETFMAVSILENFVLEFEVKSLLGHRTKVKDLPKLASLITHKLRSVFVDEIVWPSFKKMHIPVQFDGGVPDSPTVPNATVE
ncbi:hypothetical protein BJ741DRAFT_589929 [Chytriomyces cf. hyalinus JEL632]|nr:hypothetical protein BJ741DRAFT_589929 [Chytriomyces cf. hyalinus JEL632]